MRDRHDEFLARGANVAAIGMGTPAMAADFRERQGIQFPLLVDHTKKTYRILELKRGSLLDIAGPRVWLRWAKAVTGQGIEVAKQDPFQLGAAAVVSAGGELLHLHRSRVSSDNLPVDLILGKLP